MASKTISSASRHLSRRKFYCRGTSKGISLSCIAIAIAEQRTEQYNNI